MISCALMPAGCKRNHGLDIHELSWVLEMQMLDRLHKHTAYPLNIIAGDSNAAAISAGPEWFNGGVAAIDTERFLNDALPEIIKAKPQKLVLVFGSSDIAFSRNCFTYGYIINYRIILNRIEKHLPGTHVLVVSTLPPLWHTSRQYCATRQANAALEELCSEKDVEFLDISAYFERHPELYNPIDKHGIHLNQNGYDRLFAMILAKLSTDEKRGTTRERDSSGR